MILNEENSKQKLEKLLQKPQNVKVIIVADAEIKMYQLEQILRCTSLVKLDLSGNKIENFSNDNIFCNLKHLRILNLHSNQISRWQSLRPVIYCPRLIYLSIFQNPILTNNTLRHQIIQHIPSLWGLDFHSVTDEEKYDQLVYTTDSFYQSCPKSKISWPIVSYYGIDDNVKSESHNNSDENHLMYIVWREIERIRRAYTKSSAILTLQKCFRGHLSRKQTLTYKEKVMKKRNYIKSIIQHWRKFVSNKKDLLHILKVSYKKEIDRIKILVQDFRTKKEIEAERIRCTKIINKFMSRVKNFFTITIMSLKLDKYQKIYFHQDDIQQFQMIFNKLRRKFNTLLDYEMLKVLDLFEQTFKVNPENSYPRQFKIYVSKVKTYRLTQKYQFVKINKFNKPFFMMNLPAQRAKVSLDLQNKNNVVNAKYKNFDYETYQQFKYLESFRRSPILVKNLIKFKLRQQDKVILQDTTNKINRFQQREYQQLLEISIPNQKLLIEILKQVWKLNCQSLLEDLDFKRQKIDLQRKKQSTLFFIYFEYPLLKSASALKIQRSYRKYLNVKKNGMFIHQIIQKLMEQKSLLVIQRWFREIKYYHRISFFKDIVYRIRQINTNKLYLPISVYMNLQKQIQNNQNRIKFLDQQNNIFFNSEDLKLQLSNVCYNKMYKNLFNGDQIFKKVIPSWVMDSNEGIENYDFNKRGDVMHILHHNSQTSINTINTKQWISFQFESEQIARLRFIYLALQTYRFNGQQYIQLFQPTDVLSDNQKTQDQLDRIITKMEKYINATQVFEKFTKEGLLGSFEKNKILILSYKNLPQFQLGKYNLAFYPTQSMAIQKSKIRKFNKKISSIVYAGLVSEIQQSDEREFDIKQVETQKDDSFIQYFLPQSGNLSNIVVNKGDIFTKQRLMVQSLEFQKSFKIESKKSYSIERRIQHESQKSSLSKKKITQDSDNLRAMTEKNKFSSTTFQNESIQLQGKMLNQTCSGSFKRTSQYHNLNQDKQQLIDKVKEFKRIKDLKQTEKQHIDTIIKGGNLIAKQGNLFNIKKSKIDQYIQSKIIVQSLKFERIMEKESYQQRLQKQKEEKQNYQIERKNMHELEKSQLNRQAKVNYHSYDRNKQRQNTINRSNYKYVHAAFPEEIYPLEGQNHTFSFEF